jgi:ABC-2 type transport system permease protein
VTSHTGDWKVIALREISVKLHDKVFVGSMLFVLAILVVSVGASSFFGNKSDHHTVAVTDAAGVAVVEAAGRLAKDEELKVELVARQVADVEAAEDLVAGEEVAAALVPDGDGWQVVGLLEVDGTLGDLLQSAVAAESLEENAERLGTTSDELLAGSELGKRLLQEGTLSEEVRYGVGFAFAFLFYVTALTFGLAIAQSVVEEKQSRVVEILAAAVPIRQLLIGKVVGNSALALAQVVAMVGVGVLGLSLTGQAEVLAPIISAGAWFVVFFLLGFAAVACVWAVAGSVATRSEDLQATTTPVTVSVMVALFAGLFAQGKVLALVSFIPLVSSVAMPIRMLAEDVPWWQPVVSGALVLVAATALMRLGARMYEGSLLRTGRRTSWREAVRAGR